ncbi:MAG: FtsX-like permease family protein, partial [bacterium]|nr:FtsX-like permease family protein [bacterium]
MYGLLQDIRLGMRFLLKAPGMSLLAMAALALGIGAVTCVFSVVSGVLLAPLPFDEPDRLAIVYGEHPSSPGEPLGISPPAIDHMLERSRFIEGVAVADQDLQGESLTWRGTSDQCVALHVTATTFGVLGVAPSAGRFFLPEEDEYGAAPAAVLSYPFWQRRFGGDPDAVGTEVLYGGKPCTVIGILPEGFYFPVEILSGEATAELRGIPWRDPDLYFTIRDRPEAATNWMNNGYIAMARLKPGVSTRQFKADLNQMWQRIVREYIGKDQGVRVGVESPSARVRRRVRGPIVLLSAATALVLFTAWANVASLVLTRALGRRKEAAIRAALGGTTWRLARQMAAEGLVLSIPAGLLGVLLAWKALPLMVSLLPVRLPRSAVVEVDGGVLCVALLVSIAVGLLLGVVPVRAATRRLNLQAALNEGSGSGGGSARHSRFLGFFVIAEIAVAVAVLWSGAILGRSLMSMQTDVGFDVENVLATNKMNALPLRQESEEGEARQRVLALQADMLARVRALPGVEHAAIAKSVPIRDCPTSTSVMTDGSDVDLRPRIRHVSRDYFGVMGIPLVRGRLFDDSDRESTMPVAVCSERFVKRLFPDGEAVGERVMLSRTSPCTIIGVVKDVRASDFIAVDFCDDAGLYLPAEQTIPWRFSVVARVQRNTLGLADSIRESVAAAAEQHPEIKVDSVTTMERIIQEDVAEARFSAVVGLVFGAMALVLAGAGTYGVLAYWVAQRSFEVGIRMALGAAPADILKHVLRHGARLFLIGTVAGLVLGYVMNRLIESRISLQSVGA